MQTTTTDVFAQVGYDVRTTMVDRVDNQGKPCEVCALEGRYVDATVYGIDGETVLDALTVECCVFCVPASVRRMDPTAGTVKVELGDSLPDIGGVDVPFSSAWLAQLDDEADIGLMAHQDDDRLHPDAL